MDSSKVNSKEQSNNTKKIVLLPGDGIGPEVIEQAVAVLHAVEQQFSRSFAFNSVPLGGSAIDEYGDPLPAVTKEAISQADAVILGAVGGPKWDALPGHLRPESGLLQLRKMMGVFANLRPVSLHPSLLHRSTLKADILEGVDILIVRELTGGLYFGEKGRRIVGETTQAFDTLVYTPEEIERVVRIAFRAAQSRKKLLHSIDKANVLESSRLWREIVVQVASDFPDVRLEHMLVDNAAMQLIRNPRQFDVIVTENMFGDILSDEASMLSGSIGLQPSASLGEGAGLYEPIHGSAPDIAGQGVANPSGTIMSVAMMLRHSFGWEEEARVIEEAVFSVIAEGYLTSDLTEQGQQAIGTAEMGRRIVSKIQG